MRQPTLPAGRCLTLEPPLVSDLDLADVEVAVADSGSQELVAAALIAVCCACEQLVPAATVPSGDACRMSYALHCWTPQHPCHLHILAAGSAVQVPPRLYIARPARVLQDKWEGDGEGALVVGLAVLVLGNRGVEQAGALDLVCSKAALRARRPCTQVQLHINTAKPQAMQRVSGYIASLQCTGKSMKCTAGVESWRDTRYEQAWCT